MTSLMSATSPMCDDKIIRRANENGESCDALTARYTEAMHADFQALNLLPADIEPRVTTHMAEIIALIETLAQQKACLYCCGW